MLYIFTYNKYLLLQPYLLHRTMHFLSYKEKCDKHIGHIYIKSQVTAISIVVSLT